MGKAFVCVQNSCRIAEALDLKIRFLRQQNARQQRGSAAGHFFTFDLICDTVLIPAFFGKVRSEESIFTAFGW